MTDEQPPDTPDEPASLSWKPGGDEAETEATPTTAGTRPPPVRRGAPVALVIVLALLLVAALGAAGYLWVQYSDRDDRVGELENELAELQGGNGAPDGQRQEAAFLNALLGRFADVAEAQQNCIDALREQPDAEGAACDRAQELYDSLQDDLESAAGGAGQ